MFCSCSLLMSIESCDTFAFHHFEIITYLLKCFMLLQNFWMLILFVLKHFLFSLVLTFNVVLFNLLGLTFFK